ncbi:MAG: LOW QUALITY PROTEIN: hypothetical protein BJ554DRAFT_3140, partial [Olpidium bornovanus]
KKKKKNARLPSFRLITPHPCLARLSWRKTFRGRPFPAPPHPSPSKESASPAHHELLRSLPASPAHHELPRSLPSCWCCTKSLFLGQATSGDDGKPLRLCPRALSVAQGGAHDDHKQLTFNKSQRPARKVKALTSEVALQKLEVVEADIQKLKGLLDKDEKELTRREKAELADYDQQLAELRRREHHWQAEMSKASGPNLKAFRQKRYKRMSVEASSQVPGRHRPKTCQQRVDRRSPEPTGPAPRQRRRAGELSARGPKKVTSSDIVAEFLLVPLDLPPPYYRQCAKDGVRGPDWDFIKAGRTHTVLEPPDGFQRLIEKGAPLIDTPLPQFYTPDEWTKISKFNYKTTQHIHDAALSRDSSGKAYVVLRHEDFTEEMRTFLQNISVRATLLVSPSDLQVKDETEVSEGESIVDG